jgi:hypothetical protein
MRNFTAKVESFSTVLVSEDWSLTDIRFLKCLQMLTIAMDANPSFVTPSQEGTLSDFIGWFRLLKEEESAGESVSRPAFVYVNLNTGATQLFLSTRALADEKLKLRRVFTLDN